MTALTPMMQQYEDIKKQYPDTLLFYRLGDFYEMFATDAELASRELDITLTGRDAGLEQRVPMCGVPYHAADSYIAKLVQKGYKVAICEQVEDAKLAKGLVKREVIRVITPGTAFDPLLIQGIGTNPLVALFHYNHVWGLAACEVSTGDFWAADFLELEGIHRLKDELLRLNPAEILLPEDMAEKDDQLLALDEKTILTRYKKEAFNYRQAYALLLNHFKTSSLEGFGCQQLSASIASAGAIIEYLTETQKNVPQQIHKLRHYCAQDYLALDATTYRNLELAKTMRYNDRRGSLLEVLDKTKTAPGARLLRAWLERPLTDIEKIQERYSAVQVLLTNWSWRQSLRNSLEQVYDMERLMTRVLYKRALPKELLALKISLAYIPQIKATLLGLAHQSCLTKIAENLDCLQDLHQLLELALVNEPPTQIKEGGIIKNGFNATVDTLREASRHGKEWIARLEGEEREKTGIKSLKVGYNRVFGYYFEVTRTHLGAVPEYFQRKQTLANGERYVTEELQQLESQVLGAEEKLQALEETLYQKLLLDLGQAAQRVQITTAHLANIDVFQSLAEVAVKNNYVQPQLTDKENNQLYFEDLRHPVVETIKNGGAFVPNSLDMNAETNLYIITGPNMGGKSTFCRSVALAVIMAQMGCFVPATKAIISLRDKVFARVGANDDLSSGQSTFMVEMNEVSNILHHASLYSLVILDEVGRGTSTYDGLGMAWAVSEHLAQRVRAKTLFATHYHELTQLQNTFANIKNLSVAVNERGEEIIFLHKIVEGPADKSYGIQVGRLAGLPKSVIQRAQEILHQLETQHLTRAQVAPSGNKRLKPTSLQLKELLELLQGTDLQSLTPLEGLNQLHRLQLIANALEQGDDYV